ncbi:MAG: efflux RND transporter permease subunit [Methylocapsa sp.]|nr:efflux RND transporter permease subunit [Methylocapsa sp.]
MALALGGGGEQNAPLGPAVIGGLLVATVTTLVFRSSRFHCAAPPEPDAAARDCIPGTAAGIGVKRGAGGQAD